MIPCSKTGLLRCGGVRRVLIGGKSTLSRHSPDLSDFKCSLVKDVDPSAVGDRFRDVHPDKRPLVLLFGWAGATQKNLSKYSSIYAAAGCLTLGYNLPSRYVFTETAKTPRLAEEILAMVEAEGLLDRPMFLHLMSDTGIMVFQAVDLVLKGQNKKMNVVGAVLDSCPGPRPKVTLPRVVALGIVNWICCVKDGMSFLGCLRETERFLRIRVFPNLIRKFKGLPVELSLMNNTWAGDFYRDLNGESWPELFLYSKTDFYLPWKYLEEEVIKPRADNHRDFTVQRWDKSPHVSHLRAHRQEYEQAIHNFLFEKYFKKIIQSK